MTAFDKEMWEDFIVEVQENLEEFEPNLLLLEQEPKDKAILNDCFRNMHSIKGASNYMGFEKMATLAHKIENLMDDARSDKRYLDQKSFDLIFKTIDTLRSLIKDIEKNQKETLDIQELLEEFSKLEVNFSEKDEDLSASQLNTYDNEDSYELEDEELINIFQEEIKSLIKQLYLFKEEKEVPRQSILHILDDMIRVVNYMGKEDLLDKLKKLQEAISSSKKDKIEDINAYIEKLVDIFANEINLSEFCEKDDDFQFVQATHEEDKELYGIFLDFFKEVGSPLANCPEDFDLSWANNCQEAIEKLKNAANYMDYMEVVKIFEEWEEQIAEISTEPSKYEKQTFFSLWEKLEDILPGLSELFHEKEEENPLQKDKKELDNDLPSIEAESLEVFESQIDNILEGVKSDINLSDEDIRQKPLKTAISFEEDKNETGIKGQTVRVNLDKVENLLEDVAELVVLRSSMSRNAALLKELYNYCLEKRLLPTSEIRKLKEVLLGFSEDVSALERVVHQLQDGVMRIRMLPVSHLFNRLPRLVRDLCKHLNKDIELKLYGTDTTLDKQVMEQLSDPLIHIIRNAIDHGIEKPEERKSLGKSAKGKITISASQEGNFIVININDDGRGIDKDKICEKALKLGLLSKKDIGSLDDKQIYSLIFAPGISTAGQVSEISGRGVGLDVVKKKIESIGGTISVNSQKAIGTQITLRIPLTLAIIKGLVVKVGQQAMVIPVSTITETFRLTKDEISYVEGYEIISRRQETLPLIQLNKIFRGTGETQTNGKFFAVRVNFGDIEACLGVDDLISQQEIVIKPLSDYLMEQPGFAGATILGDGSIALILDLPAVLEKAKGFIKKRQQLLEMKALGVSQAEQLLLH